MTFHINIDIDIDMQEEFPLYLAALEAERDQALGAEMLEWREGLMGDGIRGSEE